MVCTFGRNAILHKDRTPGDRVQIWHEMQIGTNGRLCRFATRCRFAQEINARRARADLPGNADLHRKVTRGWTCADLPGNADLHRKATRGRTCADLPQFAKLHNKQINSPVQIVVGFHSLVNLGKEVFDGQQFKFGWLPEEGHQVDSRTSAVDSLTSRRNPLRCAWWWWRGNRRVFTCPVNYRNKFIVVFRSGFACSFLAVWCGWRPFFFSCGRRRRRSCDYTRLRVVVRICAGFRCSRHQRAKNTRSQLIYHQIPGFKQAIGAFIVFFLLFCVHS